MRRDADQLARLAETIRRLEGSPSDVATPGRHAAGSGGGLSGPWPPPAAVWCGCLHEWLAARESGNPGGATGDTGPPALSLLGDLAARVLEEENRWVAWIGRWCWPSPPALMHGDDGPRGVWRRSLFVDPPDGNTRLWASEVAARSAAVGVVVADGRGLSMAATRRLQLAARAGGALVLLARPPSEHKALAAAATRWWVQPVIAPGDRPRWRVTLMRCKGLRQAGGTDAMGTTWEVEWNHAQGRVTAFADVADRAAAPAATAQPQQRTA